MHAGATPGIGHLIGCPDDPAGLRLDTHQFAGKIAGEQMVTLKHRRGRVADRLAGGRPPVRPEHGGSRFFGIEFEHHAVDQQQIPVRHRRGNGVARPGQIPLAPERLACGRVEGVYRFFCPDYQLSFPGCRDEDG